MFNRYFCGLVALFFCQLEGHINFSGEGGAINLSSPNVKVSLEEIMVIGSNSTIDLESLANNLRTQSGSYSVSLNNATLKMGKGLILVTDGQISCSSFNPTPLIILNDAAQVSFNQELPSTDLNFVIPSGCTAQFNGPANFSGSISLQDWSSNVIFDVCSTVKFSINLNGGTLKLMQNLKIDSDQPFLSAGKIDLNGSTLDFRADISIDLTFISGGALNLLNGRSISAPMYFYNTNAPVVIQGAVGHEINVVSSVGFVVQPSCQVSFKDVSLNGVSGSSVFYLYDSIETPGVVSFDSCSLTLTGSMYFNTGKMLFSGGKSKLVGDGGSFFVINGPNARVVVDGGGLDYFCTDTINPIVFPFVLYGSDSLTFLNGGTLTSPSSQASYLVDALANNGSTVYFSDQLDLSPQSKIIVSNVDFFNPKTITIDGSGRVWTFRKDAGNIFSIGPNVSVTIANVRLSGFNSDAFSFATGSSIDFGAGVIIEPEPDAHLTWPIKALADIKFRSEGHSLFLSISGAITAQNNGINITFERCRLAFDVFDGLISKSGSSVIFKGCDLDFMGKNINFSFGDYHFHWNNNIFSTSSDRALLSFNSKGKFIVGEASNLNFGPNIDFFYDPDTSLDPNVQSTKRHFVMQDNSSRVVFDRATFASMSTGLALEHGTWIAKNWLAIINNATGTTDDFEIYQTFNMESSGAAKISFEGKFRSL